MPASGGVANPELARALGDLAFFAGFLLFGYLFYLAIWRLVTPKRWAVQCGECGVYADHRRWCSHHPPVCPRCDEPEGDHRPYCIRAPMWQRIAFGIFWVVATIVKWWYLD